MSDTIDFELVLTTAAGLPLVKIDREEYLRSALKKYYSSDIIDKAIEHNPAYAGISVDEIDKIAKASINYETTKVSGISFLAGIPGGIAMVGTVTADLTQYFGHILRVLQKLIYLYGWEELYLENEHMDDETANMLTLFVGVMFGVNGAATTITKISASAAQRASKVIAQKALTKGVIYPIVKKIAQALGIRMTKEIFAKAVSKVIPVIGGLISGGLTFFTFKPLAKKLKKHLAALPCADVNFYKNDSNFDKPIDVDFDEKFVECVVNDIESEIESDENEISNLKRKYSSINHQKEQ